MCALAYRCTHSPGRTWGFLCSWVRWRCRRVPLWSTWPAAGSASGGGGSSAPGPPSQTRPASCPLRKTRRPTTKAALSLLLIYFNECSYILLFMFHRNVARCAEQHRNIHETLWETTAAFLEERKQEEHISFRNCLKIKLFLKDWVLKVKPFWLLKIRNVYVVFQ